jgi:Putative phospholipid-binding domain.
MLALVSVALFAHSALGQSRSSRSTTGSSSQGLFGTNTVGSSSNFAAPTGSTGGTGNVGGTSTTSSNGGQNGSQLGNGSNAQNPFAQQNVASTVRGPQIQTTQQRGAFVGADSGDTTNARSLQGTNTRIQSSNNGLAQLQNLFQQGMQNVNNANQQGAQLRIPVALKLGFTQQPVSVARVDAFQIRLNRMPSVRFKGPASVTMEGRTAVLRGKVATAEDRELAAALTLMEPDVRDVRNELVVDSSATQVEVLPLTPAVNTAPAGNSAPPGNSR